jgi:ribosomal protein S9
MALTFSQLQEKLAAGEKEVRSYKLGKRKNVLVTVAQKGRAFTVYINGDKLDDNYKSQKDAEKSASEFIQLMGEELE